MLSRNVKDYEDAKWTRHDLIKELISNYNVSLDEISEKLQVSKRSLYRDMKAYTTYQELLAEFRGTAKEDIIRRLNVQYFVSPKLVAELRSS